ncbi:GntR family transcriptional regulator [Kaistia dalseonensis]|jgi:DNA-binding GntR family transcriptional regulator|uniref:DNA-binding GntR family transcriptional regulator n=1 Tax=Kaistia dalseonensis TaxID=410840 RepID=A0ABU0HDH3_9HYPH|nr:GntR family transcriptional regulator [Kaistia dalseonensis]MCX5497729.1 GntR family transcriptional regulator [Kaistia dalseonensis]MDQ0440373.1 DNA-binding GntR family transcriptional regulator [Kaistia dalseonensis]
MPGPARAAADAAPSVISSRTPLRSARATTIYRELLAAIVDHRLAPGTRLPEDEVGAVYGASRTIVRSALEALSHEGVVNIEPNRGAMVAHPTVAEARSIFEARQLIEPRVAATAALRASAADVAMLRQQVDEEHAALHSGDHRRAIVLSGDFHNSIAAIAGQPIFAGFVRELVVRSALILSLYWRRREATCATPAHGALIAALAAGNATEASTLMAEHIADLVDGLDLTERSAAPVSLADILSLREK